MLEKVCWGTIGTGWIAHQFASALEHLPEAELAAVASRTIETADRFGDRFDVARRYGSYQALVDDPGVDAVYVATPNPAHKANSLLCLRAGKPVLCEKPFAINARDAHEVIRVAREEKLFLMEAMWTRFLPLMLDVQKLLAGGAIGDVQMLFADLCIRFDFDPKDRRYDPELGGGALLDLGVYPISFASMVFGAPSRVSALAHLGETGVDEQAAVILGYDGGRLAVSNFSLRVDSPVEACILGSEGSIRIDPWWIKPSKLTLSVSGQEDKVLEAPYPGNGYQFEASEVMNCLRAGKLESEVMPLDETLSIMETLDEIRDRWGLRYPME
ncbi:Gfo/Idh/MocA family protein [Chloroflexota bacterium]